MKTMRNLRVLITAGATKEYLDPIRFISNDSSGRMGFALAAAAKKLGAKVTLISGPVNLDGPHGVDLVNVVSAQEMYREVMKRSSKADIIIMAAAVSDFRPSRFSKNKIKKKGNSTLKLRVNPDILKELGKRKKPGQMVVGFAVETDNLECNARKKLKEKKCDWIVANRHTAMGSEKGKVILFSKTGKKSNLPELLKDDLAMLILSHVLEY